MSTNEGAQTPTNSTHNEDDPLFTTGRAIEGTAEMRAVAGGISVGGRVREYLIDPDAGVIGAGDRKLTEGRDLDARTQAQAAKLEAFANGTGPTDAIPRITEVPSTDAHETVQAIYRALSRGNNREAQALARYYLHAKHASGVRTPDGSQQ